jgi:hypothetical protein
MATTAMRMYWEKIRFLASAPRRGKPDADLFDFSFNLTVDALAIAGPQRQLRDCEHSKRAPLLRDENAGIRPLLRRQKGLERGAGDQERCGSKLNSVCEQGRARLPKGLTHES